MNTAITCCRGRDEQTQREASLLPRFTWGKPSEATDMFLKQHYNVNLNS